MNLFKRLGGRELVSKVKRALFDRLDDASVAVAVPVTVPVAVPVAVPVTVPVLIDGLVPVPDDPMADPDYAAMVFLLSDLIRSAYVEDDTRLRNIRGPFFLFRNAAFEESTRDKDFTLAQLGRALARALNHSKVC
jgi:hypothetical protein